MPIYEYRCDDCEQVFEAIQRISDAPLDACRKCGGAAQRIVSSPAIQFLGSGWYVTDYARKTGEKSANGKNGAAKGAEKPDSGARAAKKDSARKANASSAAKSSSSGSESRAGSPS